MKAKKTEDVVAGLILVFFVVCFFLNELYKLTDAQGQGRPCDEILILAGMVLVIGVSGLFLIVRFFRLKDDTEGKQEGQELLRPYQYIDIETRLDSLEKLRNGAWEEFNNRRTYEWKMSLGIWTALAAFIGLILTSHNTKIASIFGGMMGAEVGAAATLILSFLHGYFMHCLRKSNKIDRRKQIFFERQIMTIINIKYDSEILELINNRVRDEKKYFLDWSERVQVAVTILLSLLACIVIRL
jgi:hypothetical protein